MKNAMTIADVLDVLYDGIGSTWSGDASFVEEVAAMGRRRAGRH